MNPYLREHVKGKSGHPPTVAAFSHQEREKVMSSEEGKEERPVQLDIKGGFVWLSGDARVLLDPVLVVTLGLDIIELMIACHARAFQVDPTGELAKWLMIDWNDAMQQSAMRVLVAQHKKLDRLEKEKGERDESI